jgi:hypothetical protein
MPGLVIRYAYLWRDEQRRGQDEGSKDRPCVVVLALERAPGRTRVVVTPITHTVPEAASSAIALPTRTARRLGLDDKPHWIITREVNIFTWPGPDIRPVPARDPPTIAYGELPAALSVQVIATIQALVARRTATTVERDE